MCLGSSIPTFYKFSMTVVNSFGIHCKPDAKMCPNPALWGMRECFLVLTSECDISAIATLLFIHLFFYMLLLLLTYHFLVYSPILCLYFTFLIFSFFYLFLLYCIYLLINILFIYFISVINLFILFYRIFYMFTFVHTT